MDIQTLIQLRSHALEQYAQVHADLAGLRAGRKALQKRAHALLADLRQLTQQINQAAAVTVPATSPEVAAIAE